jgi:hypothetical protein
VKSFVNHTKAKTLIIQTKIRENKEVNESILSVFEEMIFTRALYTVNSELKPLSGGIHAIAIVVIRKKIENTGKIFAIPQSFE